MSQLVNRFHLAGLERWSGHGAGAILPVGEVLCRLRGAIAEEFIDLYDFMLGIRLHDRDHPRAVHDLREDVDHFPVHDANRSVEVVSVAVVAYVRFAPKLLDRFARLIALLRTKRRIINRCRSFDRVRKIGSKRQEPLDGSFPHIPLRGW